ncbi:unnamed protein product, partial [Rotaria sp. Silwood2]
EKPLSSTYLSIISHLNLFEKPHSSEPLVAMPVSLMMTIGDHFEEKIIKFGNEDSNEDHDHPGQSVIQNCRSYVLPLLNTQLKVRMIDASGMEDTRGLTQDDVSIQHIISYISNILYLNAMCILLNI